MYINAMQRRVDLYINAMQRRIAMNNTIQMTKDGGDWLNKFNWDWFVTLTFREDVGIRQALRMFNKWTLELKHDTHCRIEYFMIIETGKFNKYHSHIHLLLSCAINEYPDKWERKWFEIGDKAIIKRYDSNMGAKYYLGEKLAKGDNEIFFSKGLTAPIESEA